MLAEAFIIIGIMLIAVLAPTGAIIALVQSVIKALARNPSAAFKIFAAMVVMLIFVEAISIIALLVIFQLFAK